jgi:antirestriction protein ArdC
MNANDLFETVTNDLIAAIERGASGWTMPWQQLAATGTPRSADDRLYRGWNALVLAFTAFERGYPSSTWATYQGWQRHCAQVRRGEHGTRVVLWKPNDRHTTPDDANDTDDKLTRSALFARTFTVFAAEQVDGADRYLEISTPDPDRQIGAADRYFDAIGAHLNRGGNAACYLPGADLIHIPNPDQFARPSDFYSTLAHEHTHWTGHTSRLHRDLTGRFGSLAYGAEELVAELGAAFWCAQFRLDQTTRPDHAAYLGDWLTLLRQDTRALVTACSHAQRAVDYLNAVGGWPTPTAEVEQSSEEVAA